MPNRELAGKFLFSRRPFRPNSALKVADFRKWPYIGCKGT